MSGPRSELVEQVRSELALLADPARAAGQQNYMKSEMAFLGVRVPVVRQTTNRVVARPDLALDDDQWRSTILELWDEAAYREHRYAALALARHRRYRVVAREVAGLELYDYLIRTGAWWDLVDETAHLVGDVLAAHREDATPIVRAWAEDECRWIRRVAIIAQLGHGEATDTRFLREGIEANLDDADFFIRKAIGWALRTYARTDPLWVRSLVERLGDRLSPLSIREALKHVRSGPEHAGWVSVI